MVYTIQNYLFPSVTFNKKGSTKKQTPYTYGT